MSEDRARELAGGLTAVQDRIDQACRAAGRAPAEVTLVVVTKFFPAADVCRLHDLGVRDFGENRHQEAQDKYAQVRAEGRDLRLHFIGQLQSNKAPAVAHYADVVQTVDRLKLAGALGLADRAGRPALECLLQVDLDEDSTRAEPGAPSRSRAPRGGVSPAQLWELAEAVAAVPALRLRGLMAVAPLGVDPGPPFRRLASWSQQLRQRFPQASWISAGMSGDLEAAIAHGATHVRVGTAILGSRPPLR